MLGGGSALDNESHNWLPEWERLVQELRDGRGRFAVLHGSASGSLVSVVRGLVEEVIVVGARLADVESPEQILETIAPSGSSLLLEDIDVLFAPELELDVMALIRRLANGRALVIVWPGLLRSGRFIYSQPGRGDYFDQQARYLLVMHPTESVFPDEAPFELERYPI